MKKNYLQIKLQ